MGVLVVGVFVGPFLADTYPIFSSHAAGVAGLGTSNAQQESITSETDVFQTIFPKNHGIKLLIIQLKEGRHLSTIAEKFGISTNTIRWANDLTG